MNPAGIVFGANARLDVPGSFTATTANGIKFGDQWFNATGSNNYAALLGNPNAFAFTDQPGAIVNAGDLAVADGKQLTLVGGTVVNTGKLSAPGGQITIAAVPGSKQVQIKQEGVLLALQVQPLDSNRPNPLPFKPSTLPALLTGGTKLPATGVVVNPDGTVQLTDASTTIPTTPGTAIASGKLDVSGQTGGNVGVFGDRVGVINGTINASGTNGGGTVLIGGDYQGKGSVPNATETTISQDSIIRADALANGNGGKVIAWADQTTNVDGLLTAKGGTGFWNGGLIETSGKQSLNVTSTPDASAAHGSNGTWLLDPTDITITNSGGGAIGTSTVNVANINTALNSGTNVTITTNIGGTNAGNITQSAGANIQKTAGGNTALTLDAANNITLNAGIRTNGGAVTLTAGGSITAGAIDTSTSQNTSAPLNGGNITITAATGNISAVTLRSFSEPATDGPAGTGGAISVSTPGSIVITDPFGILSQSEARGLNKSASNAGAVTLQAGTALQSREKLIPAHKSTAREAAPGMQAQLP